MRALLRGRRRAGDGATRRVPLRVFVATRRRRRDGIGIGIGIGIPKRKRKEEEEPVRASRVVPRVVRVGGFARARAERRRENARRDPRRHARGFVSDRLARGVGRAFPGVETRETARRIPGGEKDPFPGVEGDHESDVRRFRARTRRPAVRVRRRVRRRGDARVFETRRADADREAGVFQRPGPLCAGDERRTRVGRDVRVHDARVSLRETFANGRKRKRKRNSRPVRRDATRRRRAVRRLGRRMGKQ